MSDYPHTQPCDDCLQELMNPHGVVPLMTSCGWVGDSRELALELSRVRDELRVKDPQNPLLPEARPVVPELPPGVDQAACEHVEILCRFTQLRNGQALAGWKLQYGEVPDLGYVADAIGLNLANVWRQGLSSGKIDQPDALEAFDRLVDKIRAAAFGPLY